MTIVIDNGSLFFKAGFSGEESPKVVFPDILGTFKYNKAEQIKDFYVGDEALQKAGVLNIKSPVSNGVVTDWNSMEKLFNNAFELLQAKPSEHPILISEPSKISKASREKMIQFLFETYHIPSYFSISQGVLTVFSDNKCDGISLDIGEDLTQVVPVYNCHAVENAILTQNLAGQVITEYLRTLLNTYRQSSFRSTFNEVNIVRTIKEEHCICALDYEIECEHRKSSFEDVIKYCLPDGNEVVFSEEAIQAPEVLFKPYLKDLDLKAVDQLVYDSILLCDYSLQDDMYRNIVVSGGTSLMKGFLERFEKEMKLHAPNSREIKIHTSACQKDSAWLGGSLLAETPAFGQMAITKSEYDECGASLVHHKCF